MPSSLILREIIYICLLFRRLKCTLSFDFVWKRKVLALEHFREIPLKDDAKTKVAQPSNKNVPDFKSTQISDNTQEAKHIAFI